MICWVYAALGFVIGATIASIVWAASINKYFEDQVRMRELAAFLRSKGYDK
jgi:uncharacterized membrane protein YraQ (UPF0718 family)